MWTRRSVVVAVAVGVVAAVVVVVVRICDNWRVLIGMKYNQYTDQ